MQQAHNGQYQNKIISHKGRKVMKTIYRGFAKMLYFP